MKKLLFIIFFIPLLLYGQIDLCHDCAVRIYDADAVLKGECCEKCLEEFYIQQLHNNITHGKLSRYYNDFGSGNSFIDFPETLSAHFLITDFSSHKGYCLTDSGLIESRYFLISLECQDSIVQPGTTFILIVDDSSSFDIGHSYYLKLHPYFKKNQSFRIIGDKLCSVVSGPQTLFDLVYKKWLIPMLPVNQNYFFLDLIIGQLKYGYTGREFNHSHPTNVPYSSGSFDDDRYGKIGTWGDVGFAKYVDFVFNGSPEFNIYVKPTKEYVPYNKNSQYSDFS